MFSQARYGSGRSKTQTPPVKAVKSLHLPSSLPSWPAINTYLFLVLAIVHQHYSLGHLVSLSPKLMSSPLFRAQSKLCTRSLLNRYLKTALYAIFSVQKIPFYFYIAVVDLETFRRLLSNGIRKNIFVEGT